MESVLHHHVTLPYLQLSTVDIAEVISFIESQTDVLSVLSSVLTTELATLAELLLFQSGASNEDRYLNITELIQKYGYSVEAHEVETEDGYLITMYRIPGNGSPVFLMHGLLGSSNDWVTAGPEDALLYNLADEGYDVWLGNARGNVHARKHVTLSPECSDFWDFTWDEIGRYDLPAMIDYTLNVTSRSKLFYIGYSQGTTTFFVMGSERPEYNEKITAMVSLAPIAYMPNTRSPLLRLVTPEAGLIYLVLQAVGVDEILSKNSLFDALITYTCGSNIVDSFVCSNFLYLLGGYDNGQINITNFPVIFSHFPVSSSTKQLIHYGQLIDSGKFCQFDLGDIFNEEKYGNATPPDYPVSKITTPITLFYTTADFFSDATDVMTLYDQLPNATLHYVESYSHYDYLWSKNVKTVINTPIIEIIEEYETV